MSYCRFGEGDVYVFHTAGSPGLECCACILSPHSRRFVTRSEMVEHLREHESAGHSVPGDVIPNLEAEIAAIGDRVTNELGEFA